MIDEFFARIGRATSINKLNLAMIDGLNMMLPVEVVAASRAVLESSWRFRGDVPEEKVEEFTKVVRDVLRLTLWAMTRSGKSQAEHYTRTMPVPGILFFAGSGPVQKSTLIVAFPGNGGRLMMPIPTILQHLPANKVSLLLVPDNRKATYARGILPLGDTLESALLRLQSNLPQGYRRVVTFGTSSGGIPALVAAATFGADTALAVGAGHPDDERWLSVRDTGKRQLLEAAAPGLAGCKVTLAYGAQSPEDIVSAEEIRGIVPNARSLSVAIPGLEVKHVALHQLTGKRGLRPFLEEHLGLS